MIIFTIFAKFDQTIIQINGASNSIIDTKWLQKKIKMSMASVPDSDTVQNISGASQFPQAETLEAMFYVTWRCLLMGGTMYM